MRKVVDFNGHLHFSSCTLWLVVMLTNELSLLALQRHLPEYSLVLVDIDIGLSQVMLWGIDRDTK
jgi:hypothetical protein